MKKAVIIFIVGIFSFYLSSRSVELDKIIELKSKSGSKVINAVLGKKKDNKFHPGSIFKLMGNRYGITDQVNSLVLVISSEGRINKKIGKFGKNKIISPVSGTSEPDGSFYISDSSLKMILKFSKELKFEKVFISDQSVRITGIFYFRKKLYAVDTLNHRISIFDQNGKLIKTFGGRGNGDGEFNYPTHIWVDESSIYITDALNFRIQIFDLTGNYISKFGKNGKYGGDFSKPKAIAVDSGKRIYVSDVMFDNVQVFDIKGQFLTYFGGPGKDKGNFWMPGGLMIDSENKIFVCDTYNNRIQVFKISEN